MSIVTSLLSSGSDFPLITYQGQTFTRDRFAATVSQLAGQLEKVQLPQGDFVIVVEENPIYFYALLFALWHNGTRVILPTRDFLTERKELLYFTHEISWGGRQLEIIPNPNFARVEVPEDGDTIAFSSGSTGVPKGIVHNHKHFFDNAHSVTEKLQISGAVNLTFLKPYLVSAVSHFLVHCLSGSHLYFDSYENLSSLASYYQSQNHLGIVGSPVHLSSAIQFIPGQAKPQLFFSSGDFLSAATISKIIGSFPETVIFNAYGLAELAGRFFVNRLDCFSASHSYEYLGESIGGIQYRINNNQLVVNSDFLFKGYIRSGKFQKSSSWHPTSDLVQRVGEDELVLIGRSNDEIKVLGNKVSLKHIENRIKNALALDSAVLVATAHPAFGNILSLVLSEQSDLNRVGLIKKLRVVLKADEIPHQYFIIEEFPFTQTMKIDRKKIADQLDQLRMIK